MTVVVICLVYSCNKSWLVTLAVCSQKIFQFVSKLIKIHFHLMIKFLYRLNWWKHQNIFVTDSIYSRFLVTITIICINFCPISLSELQLLGLVTGKPKLIRTPSSPTGTHFFQPSWSIKTTFYITTLYYCSDEGLTLKRSAFKLFTVINLCFHLSC